MGISDRESFSKWYFTLDKTIYGVIVADTDKELSLKWSLACCAPPLPCLTHITRPRGFAKLRYGHGLYLPLLSSLFPLLP